MATQNKVALGVRYEMEAIDSEGRVKWRATADNIVPAAGLDDVLDVYLVAGTQTTTWYLLLTDASPTVAAGDTMSSHAGWSEVTTYSESVRQTWTPGAVSGQSVDNSASKASFSINGTVTVGGAGLTTDNTKGGTSGTLFSVAANNEGDRSLVSGDTLNVQATVTSSDV